jgi:hypothetical protein
VETKRLLDQSECRLRTLHLRGKVAVDAEIRNDTLTGSPVITVDRLTEEDHVVVAEGSVRAQKRGWDGADAGDVRRLRDGRSSDQGLISYLMEKDEEASWRTCWHGAVDRRGH